MKYINLGGSEISAPVIGLGCMRILKLDEKGLDALVDGCLERGINFFDHADIYGGGECETFFGKLLARRPGLREKIVIQSKCGIRKGFFDLSKEHIVGSAEGILGRLGTDRLDILLLHRPDALMEPEEIAEAFRSLCESGKVRKFGVSNMNPQQIGFLQDALPDKLIVNQLQFSAAVTGMVDRGINVNMTKEQSADRDGGVLDYCRRKDIAIQTWSPLQHGFFGGIFLGSEKYPELNAVLDRLAEEKGVTAAAVAIAWILRHPARMQVILGSTNLGRVSGMAKAAEVELSRPEWYEIYRAAGNKLP